MPSQYDGWLTQQIWFPASAGMTVIAK